MGEIIELNIETDTFVALIKQNKKKRDAQWYGCDETIALMLISCDSQEFAAWVISEYHSNRKSAKNCKFAKVVEKKFIYNLVKTI